MARSQADIRHDETRDQDRAPDQTGSRGFADDPYDGDAERLESEARLRSESISPIEHRGSSDDDGDSRPTSSSESERSKHQPSLCCPACI